MSGQWADHYSKRKRFLRYNQPLCDTCESPNVLLIDPYDNPAQWKCVDCGMYFPYEPEEEDI